MKRHKSVAHTFQYIYSFLILLFSLQLPYLLFISIQTSLANNEAPQHFKDIDFTSKEIIVFCRPNHKPHKSILVEFEFFTLKCIKTAVLSFPKIWV